jgi:hypothetical protein
MSDKITYVQTTVDAVALVATPVKPGESVKTDSLITASRMGMWNDCRRKHHYRYNVGYAAKGEGVELTFGSLWHKYMEFWWADRRDLFPKVLAEAEKVMDSVHFAYFSAMMSGYDAAHRDEKKRYTVVALEKEFRGIVFDPTMVSADDNTPQEVSGAFALAGKMDGILQSDDDQVLDPATHTLLEHKTTSQTIADGDPYWDKLQMDHQVSIYVIGCDAMGYNVTRCLYDVARKPLLRQKKGETYEQFVQRVHDEVMANLSTYFRWRTVPRQTGEVISAAKDVWETARLMEIEKSAGFSPRNPAACYKYGGGHVCVYFSTCMGAVQLEDNADLTRKKPFTELDTTGEI